MMDWTPTYWAPEYFLENYDTLRGQNTTLFCYCGENSCEGICKEFTNATLTASCPDYGTSQCEYSPYQCTDNDWADRTLKSPWFLPVRDFAISAVYTVVGLSSAMDMGEFSGAWSRILQGSCNSQEHHTTEPAHGWKSFMQSPVGHTIISSITFTAAATGLYHLHSSDVHRDSYLLAGIALGAGIGLGVERDLQGAILKVMPWTILLALLGSIIGHRFFHKKARNEEVLRDWRCNPREETHDVEKDHHCHARE